MLASASEDGATVELTTMPEANLLIGDDDNNNVACGVGVARKAWHTDTRCQLMTTTREEVAGNLMVGLILCGGGG